uniref:Uncharacterized protein n=1 Tax=Opuntia streptacantha TaxID=393608 RepID=A0A7C8Z339_OPUST
MGGANEASTDSKERSNAYMLVRCFSGTISANIGLFVAAAFQVIMSPIINKTKPCIKAEEGSLGNPNNSIAAKGMAEPALIWDKIILPELGKRIESKSPIFPPNKAPMDAAIEKRVMSSAVVSWEKPMSSNHNDVNDNADHGKDPDTPWATII